MNVPYGERFLPKRTFALAGKRKTPPTVSNQPNVGGFLKKSDENHMKINFHQLVSAVGSKKDKIAAGLLVLYAQAASAGDVQAFDKLYTQLTRRTQPVSKCNSPVNPGCSILRGQSTLAHSPPSPSQFFTPIANVGANSFKQRSTDRARFRFFDACSCS